MLSTRDILFFGKNYLIYLLTPNKLAIKHSHQDPGADLSLRLRDRFLDILATIAIVSRKWSQQ